MQYASMISFRSGSLLRAVPLMSRDRFLKELWERRDRAPKARGSRRGAERWWWGGACGGDPSQPGEGSVRELYPLSRKFSILELDLK